MLKLAKITIDDFWMRRHRSFAVVVDNSFWQQSSHDIVFDCSLIVADAIGSVLK